MGKHSMKIQREIRLAILATGKIQWKFNINEIGMGGGFYSRHSSLGGWVGLNSMEIRAQNPQSRLG